jgi:dynein heavy chain, axonemal
MLFIENNGRNDTTFLSGLEDQMLARVVAEERPDLEEMKNTLIISNATMCNELKGLEDTILEKLSTSENPVDDIELITALEASKAKSSEIKVGSMFTICSYLIDNRK